jgi:hypothetical protein
LLSVHPNRLGSDPAGLNEKSARSTHGIKKDAPGPGSGDIGVRPGVDRGHTPWLEKRPISRFRGEIATALCGDPADG